MIHIRDVGQIFHNLKMEKWDPTGKSFLLLD